MTNRTYYFLDVRLEVTAPRELAEAFHSVYGRFARPCGCPSCRNGASALLTLTCEVTDAGYRFHSQSGDVTVDRAEGFAYLLFFVQNTVIRASRAYLMIHGAVVECDTRGVIVSAASGQGKTTLCLELVRRGAGFLSDEIAPIPLAGGPLHAFPRAVGVRQPTLDLLGLSETAGTRSDTPDFKVFLDIPTVYAQPPLDATTLHTVVYLAPPPDVEPPRDPDADWIELTVYDHTERLIAHLVKREGIRSARCLEGRKASVIRVAYDRDAPIVDLVDRAAREAHVILRGHYRGRSLPPTFEGAAQVGPLSKRKGLELLISAALNSRNLIDGGLPLALLLMRLGQHLGDVQFWELGDGSLDSSAALVEQVSRFAADSAF